MDRRIGVIGNAEEASAKALFLRTYSRDVIFFDVDRHPAPPGIRKLLTEAGVEQAGRAIRVECHGKGAVVQVEDGRQVDVDVLYPALGCEVRCELATELGADCDEDGNLKVGSQQETSVEGLFAAGDVVSDLHQLAVATGHAAIAATAIHKRLDRNLR